MYHASTLVLARVKLDERDESNTVLLQLLLQMCFFVLDVQAGLRLGLELGRPTYVAPVQMLPESKQP